MVDNLKLFVAFSLIAAGFFGYYWFSESPSILRGLLVIVGLALGGFVFCLSSSGARFLTFVREAWVEGKKVNWPAPKEAVKLTGVVFLFVVLVAVFLWLVDTALLWGIRFLLGYGG